MHSECFLFHKSRAIFPESLTVSQKALDTGGFCVVQRW
jgi:hypothetical protein